MMAVTSTQSPPIISMMLAQTLVDATTLMVPVMPSLVRLESWLGVADSSGSSLLEKKVSAEMTRARAATAATTAQMIFFNSGFMV